MIYRPPDTSYEEFIEAMNNLKKFMESIEEDNASPTICLTGDLNMPFLTDWTPAGLESFLAKAEERENTAENKKQAVILIKFLKDNFMTQHIKESTRKGNLLDLFCSNDASLVLRCWQTVNTALSDHNTVFIPLSYGLENAEDRKRTNHSEACIPEYDLRNGVREDWLRFNLLLQQRNWDELFEDKSVNEMTKILLEKCEENVKKIFKLKNDTCTDPPNFGRPPEPVRPPQSGRPPETTRPPGPCRECDEEKVHECGKDQETAPKNSAATNSKNEAAAPNFGSKISRKK